MKKIQNMLVVIDNDNSSQSDELPIELKKSLRLAADKESVQIHLLSVAYQKYLHHDFLSLDFNQLQRRDEYCDQIADNLNKMASELINQGYDVVSHVAWGYPSYEKIIKKADEVSADLIVKHCRAYGKIEFHHLTNDSWQLVRHCPVPLLLVKNRPWSDQPTVLAAVDPMHNHDKPLALDYRIMAGAQTLQEKLDGELHVIHAYAETARPFAPAGVIEKQHRVKLDDFLSAYSLPESNLHFLDETPIMALAQKTEELDVDIIAMGAMSRSRLSELLVGSTAEQVLDFMTRDILILKSSST